MDTRIEQLRLLFASEPLVRSVGARLVELERGRAAVDAVAREDFLVSAGIVQGGITAILADYAGVYAAMSIITAGHTPAVQMSLNFLRPIKAGEVISAAAKVVHETGTMVTVAFEVSAGAGAPKAIGTILYAKPKKA